MTDKSRSLTVNQNLQIVAIQILFLLSGIAFLFIGGGRVAVALSGGAVQTTVGHFAGDSLVTTTTLLIGIALALLGYYLVWASAAIGAKEPPAWNAGRNGLAGLLIAATVLAAFLLVERPDLRLQVVLGYAALGGLAVYLLMQINQLDYRLALGAERLRKREIKIFTFRNVALVLIISSLTVLGIVYAILIDFIELPVRDTQPNELLFITDFENFNDEWDLYPGRNAAEIVKTDDGNQRLVITVDSGILGDGVYSLLNRKFRDFDLRVTTTQLDSDPFHDNRYGVVFRHRDTKNFYEFEISGDGYYRLVKVKDDTAEEISTWIPTTDFESDSPVLPSLIRPGSENQIQNDLDATNEIRIVARGNRFWFFVNGRHLPLCQKGDNQRSLFFEVTMTCESDDLTPYYEDNDFEQGRIGLLAGSTPSSGSETVRIAFDHLLIVGPESGELPSTVELPQEVHE